MENAVGTGYDAVQEAIQREEFDPRTAVGDFEEYEVAVFAYLSRHDTPSLAVHAGGTFEHYDDENVQDEYAGGESLQFQYGRLKHLKRDYRELVDQYDLEEVDG